MDAAIVTCTIAGCTVPKNNKIPGVKNSNGHKIRFPVPFIGLYIERYRRQKISSATHKKTVISEEVSPIQSSFSLKVFVLKSYPQKKLYE